MTKYGKTGIPAAILAAAFMAMLPFSSSTAAKNMLRYRIRARIPCIAESDCSSASLSGAPEISAIGNLTYPLGAAIDPVPFSVSDRDTPADQLIVQAHSLTTSIFPQNGIVLQGAGANRFLHALPAPLTTGAGKFRITVSDGHYTTEKLFSITITPPAGFPWISGNDDISVVVGNAIPHATLTVGDDNTAAPALLLSVTGSSDPVRLPAPDVLPGAADDARELHFSQPAPQTTGDITISLSLADQDGKTTEASLVVHVLPNPGNAPSLGDLPDISAEVGSPIPPVSIEIADHGANQTPADQLQLVATSSNPALLPNPAITGTGSPRSMAFSPVANHTGLSIISITVTDNDGQSATKTFRLTITPSDDQPPAISSIPDRTVAFCAGIPDVEFTVSDAGGNATPPENIAVEFASSDPDLVAPSALSIGTTGGARILKFFMPTSGRSGTATITLTARDAGGKTAQKTFAVTILPPPPTTPTIAPCSDITVYRDETVPPVLLTVGDDTTPPGELVVLAGPTNIGLISLSSLVISAGPTASGRLLAITPIAGQTGTSGILLDVMDNDGEEGFCTFSFTVLPLPQNPVISAIDDLEVPFGSPLPQVVFSVEDRGDSPTAPGDIEIQVFSNNSSLVPPGIVGPEPATDENRTLDLVPVAGVTGTATITVVAIDAQGNTGEETFSVTVLPPPATNPVIDPVADIQKTLADVIANGIADIAIYTRDQGDNPTPAGNLAVNATVENVGAGAVTASADDLPLGVTDEERLLRLTPTNVVGTSKITLTSIDGDFNVGATSFYVRVSIDGNAAPVIGPVADQVVNQDSSIEIDLYPTDDQNVCSVTISAASADEALVPQSGISTYGVSGAICAHRRVKFIPAAGKYGTTTITVTAADAQNAATQVTFQLRVNAKPVISGITKMWGYRSGYGMPVTMFPFTVVDPDGFPSSLTVSGIGNYYISDSMLVVNARGGSSYEIGYNGTATVLDSTVTIRANDGMAITNLAIPCHLYGQNPKALEWVEVPATTIPGGISVPAFSTLRRPADAKGTGDYEATRTFADSVNYCKEMGPNYRLMTHRQRMALVSQLLSQPENWTGTGKTIGGTNYLTAWGDGVGRPIQGMSDGNWTGWWYPALANKAITDTNFGYYAYKGTFNDYNQIPGTTIGIGAEQRRTHILGDISIWSIGGGNKREIVWCDDENSACENGYVKPGASYTGLSPGAVAHALSDSGITSTWLLPEGGLRVKPGLGTIIDNAGTTDPSVITVGGNYADGANSGIYALRIEPSQTGSYRCTTSDPPVNKYTNLHPVIAPIGTKTVVLGSPLSVSVTIDDADDDENNLQVRAFRNPDNNIAVNVTGTGSTRTITANTNAAADPQVATFTVVATDPEGAAGTADFTVVETRDGSLTVEITPTPASISFTCHGGTFPENMGYRDIVIQNTGNSDLWGGITAIAAKPFIFAVQRGDPDDPFWCPFPDSIRALAAGATCHITVMGTCHGEPQATDTLTISAPGVTTKTVNMAFTYNIPPCTGPGCPNPCPGGGCPNPCPEGGCINTCIGGGCSNDCLGGNCPNPCLGGNCPNPCTGGNCPNPCYGGNCPNPCTGGNCSSDTPSVPLDLCELSVPPCFGGTYYRELYNTATGEIRKCGTCPPGGEICTGQGAVPGFEYIYYRCCWCWGSAGRPVCHYCGASCEQEWPPNILRWFCYQTIPDNCARWCYDNKPCEPGYESSGPLPDPSSCQ